MKKRNWDAGFNRFARTFLTMELLLAGANLAITYVLGWRGLSGYAEGLVFAGLSAIGLGIISFTGERAVGMGPCGFGQIVMPSPLFAPVWQRRSRASEDRAFVWPLGIAGLVALSAGALILALI